MSISCSGYNETRPFTEAVYCEHVEVFNGVPAATCRFEGGGYVAQYKVTGGKNCSLFFERFSGGGYYGIQPQWTDYGLSCD